ncbi:AsmA family protein [Corallincola luteus]|uniref:AsmA family protein n=1 Tax=Corallincola luteus TaxID=1775177 RepID=A0ABY2ALD6_9GAMM|nr:AsmA family protein [Corallincola luteus]TCI03733.1 AsmA family protein [Corallincola luteus]
MKVGKWLLGIVGVVVIVAGVLIYGVLSNLDSIVKTLVEKVGSDVTKVEVTLDSVNIKLTDGRGELQGLTLGNPTGFGSDYLFDLNDIVLDIDPASLTKDVYVINEIKVDGAKLIAEQKGGSTNLQALLKGMQSGAQKPAEQQPKESQPAEAGADVKLAVEKFTLSNNAVTLMTEQFGEHKITMPTIALTNLGSASKGLTPEQLTSEIVSQITKQVEKRVTEELKKLAEEKVKEKAKDKLEGGLLDKLGG